MEPAFQIKIVRENLALAMALWAAAQRGVITAAFVPASTEFKTASGEFVKVSTPLELRDTRELVRCAGNQIRGAFAFSAMQTHRTLEAAYRCPRLQETDPDLRAVRCFFYLLNHALSRNMMSPVWDFPQDYRGRFEAPQAHFALDTEALAGKEVGWDDFGGLERYLSLLEYCCQRVAEAPAPPPWAALIASPSEPPEAVTPEGEPLDALDEGELAEEATVTVGAGAIYRGGEDDPVLEFIATRCQSGPGSMSVAKDLYEAYLDWCREQGAEPLAQRSFGMALTAQGFERRRRGRGRHWWVGVGLR